LPTRQVNSQAYDITANTPIIETTNNMWFLGKRETVNAWKKADFDGFRDKEE
jgi:hypothetical protein